MRKKDKEKQFISGLELGKLFYEEMISPIMAKDFPRLKYSAGLLGEGSEILGYDTIQSTDHCWGPRVMLFLDNEDYQKLSKKVSKTLIAKIPAEFKGYPTKMDCPVKNTIDIFTIKSFFDRYLKIDPYKNLKATDWLSFPSQRLLEINSGQIYRDDLGLDKIREKFFYYPRNIWLYVLSCQWTKISQEEAFVGRTGDVGDELGSRIVTARLARELIKLCFLMEKKYAPYTKWFGTAFMKLHNFNKLSPILRRALLAQSWKEREKWLSKAYTIVAQYHNSLKITEPLSIRASKYHKRPYLVIHADQFAKAIKKQIRHKDVKDIKTNIGSIDQFVDSTDALSYPEIFQQIKIWEK